MKLAIGLLQLLLCLLSGWLLAQTVLAFWHSPDAELQGPHASFQPTSPLLTQSLLVEHWQPRDLSRKPPSDTLPPTQLPLRWLGQLREQQLAQSIVVLGYGNERLVLGQGDRLAPGIRLERIDSQGLIIDNNGRLERFAWPQLQPLAGVRRLDG
ncbi:hypothetical protein [Marinobacterium mangrovicola]|uniref:General secretion pathway protein C n=1 Tax=Marinobacterium mangrovicola TaxID=1476959 RepID=A0A4R1G6Z2_9GAMM|nr:hypothetical protein [Marinobacterium mangrovicola]TCK03544.1 general secretion pathway protein C [Marinobacterium mangrovicola]